MLRVYNLSPIAIHVTFASKEYLIQPGPDGGHYVIKDQDFDHPLASSPKYSDRYTDAMNRPKKLKKRTAVEDKKAVPEKLPNFTYVPEGFMTFIRNGKPAEVLEAQGVNPLTDILTEMEMEGKASTYAQKQRDLIKENTRKLQELEAQIAEAQKKVPKEKASSKKD